jgi:hypothetical protein
MKIYVNAPDTVSRSIFRVERALRRFAPRHIQFTDRMHEADLVVLHVIGWGSFDGVSIDFAGGQRMAVIQYCLRSTENPDPLEWERRVWSRSVCVWSYYDLGDTLRRTYGGRFDNFYYAPLGVDPTFTGGPLANPDRGDYVVTSGYVNHPAAEAISEIAYAAQRAGIGVVHLGPVPEGMPADAMIGDWRNVHDITDTELATIYEHARWVSGLRHVEGFELPALEGLACGARPILFDRPEMRQWYRDHAVYVPESSGEPLIARLAELFSFHKAREAQRVQGSIRGGPVEPEEVFAVRTAFGWRTIIDGFWARAIGPIMAERAYDADHLEAM